MLDPEHALRTRRRKDPLPRALPPLPLPFPLPLLDLLEFASAANLLAEAEALGDPARASRMTSEGGLALGDEKAEGRDPAAGEEVGGGEEGLERAEKIGRGGRKGGEGGEDVGGRWEAGVDRERE